MEIESTTTLYALSIKGGYYDKIGEITGELTDARLFQTKDEAVRFREFYDPCHKVDCSILLQLTVFISKV